MTSGNELKKTTIAAGSGGPEFSDSAAGVYKRLQTLFSDTRSVLSREESDVIALRVPKRIKILYTMMTLREKRMFKELFIKVLEGFAKQVENQNININININMVNNEVKAGRDPEVLERKIEVLEEENKDLKYLVKHFRKKYMELSEIVRKMPADVLVGSKYVDFRKLSILLQLLKKAKDLVK